MTNKILPPFVFSPRKSKKYSSPSTITRKAIKRFIALALIFAIYVTLALPTPFNGGESILPESVSPAGRVSANNAYFNLNAVNLSFAVTPSNVNQISTNDDWSAVNSVEGYFGRNLTATHGVDPQTVLGTEFTNNLLPTVTDTQVNANKGNPSAYNAGGVTEFDTGTYYAIGFQGNVQANPYLVFYVNATGLSNITMSYQLTDIDGGSNNSISPVALQYRVGETGNFTNIPAGFVADVTDGPNIAGRMTTKSVTLPAACNNQPQLQLRLITTNAADTSGSSTPDEWIGVNNISIGVLAPTAATATVGGRVFSSEGRVLSNASIVMYDPTGSIQYAKSNTFGYYSFRDVPVGATYVFEVQSKRYVFSQSAQVVNVAGDMDGINFYADPISEVFYKTPMNRKGL